MPSYSIDSGLSEWGMGWGAQLSIQRHRPVGHLAYDATDEFLSPWGRLVQGEGGAYFPANLSTQIALVPVNGGWVATTGEGVTYTFLAADAVTTPRGTFEWPLSRVDTVVGDSTQFTWSQADAYPYLTSVHWGKRGDGRAYEANLIYENVEHPWTSFAPGIRRVLGQRVKRVSVRSRDAGGTYRERWRYDFVYTTTPIGASYYMTSIARTFASGESEPATTYDYDFGVESTGSATFVRAPRIDPYLQLAGPTGFQPDKSSITDIDDDGLPDLEYQYDQKQVHQTEFGLELSDLPARTGTENPLCRPAPAAGNQPRVLARLYPDAAEPQVLVVRKVGAGSSSSLYICDRKGIQLASQTLPTNWELTANTRLADVDGDLRPDLVRVQAGSITIAFNDSSPGTFHFAAPVTTTLGLTMIPLSTWITDENGDGLADLFVRWANGVVVLHGLGRGSFEAAASVRPLYDLNGQSILHLSENQFTFGDFNKDGLADLLLTRGRAMVVLTNRGTYYQQVSMPGLSVGWDFGLPVNVDLTGSGETEVVVAFNTQAWTLRVTTPGMGMLRAIHDNKGNHVRLAYERAPVSAGAGSRPAVLQELTVTSSGQDPVSTQYEYANPVVHTKGKFLVGYETTRRISPFVMEEVTFHHDDDISGLVTGTLTTDSRSTYYELTSVEHEEASYLGVRLLRARSTTLSTRSLDGSELIFSTAEMLSYERGNCVTSKRTTNEDGAFESDVVLADVALLDNRLHCLSSAVRSKGSHVDHSLDFDYTATLARDDAGQISRIIQLGDGAPIVLQDVTYDALHRLQSLSAPGEGVKHFDYDPPTGLLTKVTGENLATTQVNARDAITDSVLELSMDQGAGAVLTSRFRFDGQERLGTKWDDSGISTEFLPDESLSYAYSTDERPAIIHARNLVATGSFGEQAILQTSIGQPVATLSRAENGWLIGQVARADPNTLESRTWFRSALSPGIDPSDVTWNTLMAGADLLSISRQSGFGATIASQQAIQSGVWRSVSSSSTISNGELVDVAVENEAYRTSSATGAAGHIRWRSDEMGNVTRMSYDTLGRLRRLYLPGGATQAVDFDRYGRPSEVRRSGIATIRYAYDPVIGFATSKVIIDSDGVVDRIVEWSRDSLGRVVRETDRKQATGQAQIFEYKYDGDVFDGDRIAGQLGHVTEIRGSGFIKRTTYNRDGTARLTSVRIDGFRQVNQEFTYFEDRTPQDITTTITDASGATLYRLKESNVVDAFGHIGGTKLDDVPFTTLSYDLDGNLSHVDGRDGFSIALHYDPLTRTRSGYWEDAGTWNAGVDTTADARGNTASDTISFDQQTWIRTYGFDARGFLTSANDREQSSAYDYDLTGRPHRITDSLGDRTVVALGRLTLAGPTSYQYDAEGRVVRRDDLVLEYGPNGQAVRATVNGHSWFYDYDEGGQRLAKRRDGVVVSAYVGALYIDAVRAVLPVRLGGRVVGVFVLDGSGKHFEPLATDPRGTLLGAGGTPNLPTPFGSRASHPELSIAIDYVEKAFDADIGTVRMGLRDYDPRISQFLTPDPLFLEDIEEGAGSPIESNLFSYARNNPVDFVDSEGQKITPLLVAQKEGFNIDGNYRSMPALSTDACLIVQATRLDGSVFYVGYARAYQTSWILDSYDDVKTIVDHGGVYLDHGPRFDYEADLWIAQSRMAEGDVVGALQWTAQSNIDHWKDPSAILYTAVSVTVSVAASVPGQPTRPNVTPAAPVAEPVAPIPETPAANPPLLLTAGKVRQPRLPGPTVDPATGQPVGRFVVDPKGNAMIEPVGGGTVAAGQGGADTHTTYPNGANYQRLNPGGHGPTPNPLKGHGHGHLPGTGPGKAGQGPSIDPQGNQVPFNSADAHWDIKK